MPIEMKIWKIADQPQLLSFEPMQSEAKLEKLLMQDIRILSPHLFLIGSQVITSYGKFIDLMALDDEGNIVVIELKRDKTPRDAVSQLLDYASWVKGLVYEDVERIYSEKNNGKIFAKSFLESMQADAPEELSGNLKLLLVASTLDPESERIMNFLSENYGVPINAAFFRYFQDGGSEYLTRTWLIDPSAAEANVAKSSVARSKERWNESDFYVAFGEDDNRNWEDARSFGFVSAGGGRRYSRPLSNLFVGSRVFVHVPGRGYVGVGKVTDQVKTIQEFTVQANGAETNILDAQVKGKYLTQFADDPELAEYFVPITWESTVSADKAFWKAGMYANPNIVTKLRNQTTLALLKEQFGLKD
jgi:hypothetical protein